MRHFKLLLLISLLLSACGQTPASQPSKIKTFTEVQNALPQGVTFMPKNEEHYHQFADWHEAAKWYPNLQDRQLRIYAIEEPQKILEQSDPRQVRASAAVSKIWAVLAGLFPKETVGLKQPQVLAVESKDINAFVPGMDEALGKLPAVVVFHSAILEEKITDEQLESVVAHELAHLAFKHGWPEADEKIERFYRANNADVFGFEQVNDKNIESQARMWMRAAHNSGGIRNEALNKLPSNRSVNNVVLRFALEKASQNKPECANLNETRKSYGELVKRSFSRFDYTFRAKQEDLNQISDLTTEFIIKAKDCVEGLGLSYGQLINERLNLKSDHWGKADAQNPMTNPNINVMEVILGVTSRDEEVMASVEDRIDLKKIRYYSTEEQADDISVLVFHKMGRTAEGMSSFMLGLLEGEDRSMCESLLASGAEPPQGGVFDNHHTSCWRAWHVRKLFEALPSVTQGT